MPTSVAVVIELKDNTQTNTDRHRQADRATHSAQQVSIATLLPHPYAMRCARLNSICCIVGTSLAILLRICLAYCCRSHSEATMQQRVVITLARVHGFAGVTCVISLSLLHTQIIMFTFHNFICHNSFSSKAVSLSISIQNTHSSIV